MKNDFKLILLLMVLVLSISNIARGSTPSPQDIPTTTELSEPRIVHEVTTETLTTESVPTTEETQETPTTETETTTTVINTTIPPDLNIPLSEELINHIYEQCNYDVDLYCLIIAMIDNESNFDAYAVSYDGHDHGLMQLRDLYYSELIENYNVSNPKEPFDNVIAGTSMIKEYIEKYEHKNLALMCYNCGEGGAQKLWKRGVYSTEYTVKVLNDYEKYMREAQNKGVNHHGMAYVQQEK